MWNRAQLIAFVSDVKYGTSAEVHDDCAVKGLWKTYEEAKEAESILKNNLLDLESDRASFIKALTLLYQVSKEKSGNPLWDKIGKIISEENEKYAFCDRAK